MQRLCMAFDIYFNDDIYETCDPSDDKFVGKYLAQLNKKQSKGKTFDNTIEEGFYFSASCKIDLDEEEEEEVIDPKLIVKWGKGLNPIDYETLESHYKYLKAANPRSDNSNQEIFIKNLCYSHMQLMKAVREDRVDDYNKLTETYRKSFTQAGLKAVADTNEIADFAIGVTAETIEQYTPTEYYKNKKLFADFDGLGEYFQRFVLRPLKKLQHGIIEADSEFFVGDEDAGIVEVEEDDD